MAEYAFDTSIRGRYLGRVARKWSRLAVALRTPTSAWPNSRKRTRVGRAGEEATVSTASC